MHLAHRHTHKNKKINFKFSNTHISKFIYIFSDIMYNYYLLIQNNKSQFFFLNYLHIHNHFPKISFERNKQIFSRVTHFTCSQIFTILRIFEIIKNILHSKSWPT